MGLCQIKTSSWLSAAAMTSYGFIAAATFIVENVLKIFNMWLQGIAP